MNEAGGGLYSVMSRSVSVGCTDKPCIVDSVPDHMVVVAFQKLAAFIPVVVQEPNDICYSFWKILEDSRTFD